MWNSFVIIWHGGAYWWWITLSWFKNSSTWPWCCCALAVPFVDVETQVTSFGKTKCLFQGHSRRPMTFSEEICVFVSGFKQACATSTWNSYYFCDRSHGRNFAATCFMPRSSFKISDTVVRRIPNASNSHTFNCWFSLIAAHMRSRFSGVLLVEDLPERLSICTDSQPPLKLLYHNCIWALLIESSLKAFLIIGIVSVDECPSLNQNLMQIHWSARSVIVNATVTQHTSSVAGVSLPTC